MEQEKTEETFNWFKYWWPVQYTYNLDDDRPNRIELLGEFFAVWKSKSGEWIAMKDMCPHRLAPLSEGTAFTLHNRHDRLLQGEWRMTVP